MNQSPDKKLLSLSQEMLASAQANQWEHVAQLEQQRLALFNQIFADGVNGYEGLAREILSLDAQTMELARASLPAIRNELLKIRDGSNANKAYQTIQRSTVGEK